LLSRYGIQLGLEYYCSIGCGVDDVHIYETVRTRAPLPGRLEFLEENEKRTQMARVWSLAEIPVAAETVSMLKSLDEGRVGLVTNSDRSEVKPILRAAQIYDAFDAMVFGEDVDLQKPSPAPYQLVSQKLGITTGIAFEDSESGLTSARAAGFRAVKVEHPRDLPRMVAQYLSGA
jgi:HAD superfamily hydrolase (TIGR01509 family)